jgi:hypothetical protein
VRRKFVLPGAILVAIVAGCGFVGPEENNSLSEVCSVEGASVADIHASPFLTLENSAQAVIYFSAEDRYALLKLPECQVAQLPDLAGRRGRAGIQVLPGGGQLLKSYPPPQDGVTKVSYVYAYSPQLSMAPMVLPESYLPASPEFPILSEDGAWLAILRPIRTSAENRNEIVLRKPLTGDSRIFWPRDIEISWYELVAIDVAKQEIVLSRGLRDYLWIAFDGRVIRGPVNTGAVQAQPPTFRWVGDGWFAWDAYRDAGSYGFRLKTSPLDRYVAAEKLRSISHAAISPDARHAAMSLETQHGRLLWLRDAVAVIDTASGREIFRRYLPRFSRTQVAFPGNKFFAYSEPGRVRVLRLP